MVRLEELWCHFILHQKTCHLDFLDQLYSEDFTQNVFSLIKSNWEGRLCCVNRVQQTKLRQSTERTAWFDVSLHLVVNSTRLFQNLFFFFWQSIHKIQCYVWYNFTKLNWKKINKNLYHVFLCQMYYCKYMQEFYWIIPKRDPCDLSKPMKFIYFPMYRACTF